MTPENTDNHPQDLSPIPDNPDTISPATSHGTPYPMASESLGPDYPYPGNYEYGHGAEIRQDEAPLQPTAPPVKVIMPDEDFRQIREVIGLFSVSTEDSAHDEAYFAAMEGLVQTIADALVTTVQSAAQGDIRLLDLRVKLEKPEGFPNTEEPVELVLKALGRYEPPMAAADGTVTKKGVPRIKSAPAGFHTPSGIFVPPKPAPVAVTGIYAEDGTFQKFQEADLPQQEDLK
jgi:hypothetical protein